MAVFIELTTDAFEDIFKQEAKKAQNARRAGVASARRPMRGLEIKEDTHAMMKVIKANGEEIGLLDSGSRTGQTTGYTNFLLQNVQEARMEKNQIIDTFGEAYIYFFGEAPRFLDCTAMLVNSNDFNWEAEFWANYERYLRGTRCAEIGARVYLFYDDNIVDGYMVMAQAMKNAMDPMGVQLTFRLFLTGYQNISLIGDPFYPIREGVSEESVRNAGDDPRPGFIPVTNPFGLFADNKDEWTGAKDDVILAGALDDVDLTGISGDHPQPTDRAVIDELLRIIQSSEESRRAIDNHKSLQRLGVNDSSTTNGGFGMLGPVPGDGDFPA